MNSSSLHKYDIGNYFQKAESCTESEIHDLIKNVEIPERNYNFQKKRDRKKKRIFRHEWLTRFLWLQYSKRFYKWWVSLTMFIILSQISWSHTILALLVPIIDTVVLCGHLGIKRP